MASLDSMQLYCDYHSFSSGKSNISQCSKQKLVWSASRRKTKPHRENMATEKCQRLIKSRCKAKSRTAVKRYSDDGVQDDTPLFNNQQDNKSSCVLLNVNQRYCVEDNNEVSKADNAVDRKQPIRKYFSCYNKANVFTLALLLLIGLCFDKSCGFVLDGTQTSHATFRKWYTGLNGTLELEFKTEQPNGLVLYTDDGGTYDFFELKLVEGSLRLRYNLGGGAQIITVGRDLHDGHWHKVQVS